MVVFLLFSRLTLELLKALGLIPLRACCRVNFLDESFNLYTVRVEVNCQCTFGSILCFIFLKDDK